jgi:citrate synthase
LQGFFPAIFINDSIVAYRKVKPMSIKERIAAQLPAWRERVSSLKKEYGNFKVCDVTVDQIYGGIRGVQISVSDVSYVDPPTGIRLRGYTVPQVLDLLPRAPGSEIPLVGGLYYLLMTDELPSEADALEVEAEWRQRSTIPAYVYQILHSMPPDTHPMTLFSQGIMAMANDSVFAKKYREGLQKNGFWEYYLEDSLNLTARLPILAAFIYNLKYRNSDFIAPNPDLDWAANFAWMIGRGDNHRYTELSRLFFVLHSDHEGANVSAHATHLVCSALSDVYLGSAAGMTGLAGPLHGLANQECLRWLLNTYEHFGRLPSETELEAHLRSLLAHGELIPGYGHAVLRTTDPRFTAQLEWGEKYCPEEELFKLVKMVYKTLPPILTELGKVSNPWPNVDAINGVLQYHFGLQEFDFYTVLFGVSRILGLTCHTVWARALGKPIERPKSLTTCMLEDMVGSQHTLALDARRAAAGVTNA